MRKSEIGDILECLFIEPLEGNDVAPNLKKGNHYTLKAIVLDSKGNEHYDVGIPSECYTIRSYETKEFLPNGDKIHWCHSSRFKNLSVQ